MQQSLVRFVVRMAFYLPRQIRSSLSTGPFFLYCEKGSLVSLSAATSSETATANGKVSFLGYT